MKKIFRNSRIIAVAFLTLFSAAATHASDSSGVNPAIAAELKFAGMVKNDPVFELNIAGSTGQDDYVIKIADNQGNTLYRENIKAENFTKRFLLSDGELGDETLIFEIISRKTKQVVRFEVSSHSRNVNETLVNRVK
ncbi:MAG: hypothetical protein ACT4OJ_10540 [Bacteroidota bacterium]